jgi:GNAT superfamily N-acetyltransferase
MTTVRSDLTFTRASAEHLPRFEEIRAAAFAPVFASFRALLGDELYERVQAKDDAAQPELLASILTDPVWELYAVEHDAQVVAFVSVRLDHERKVGEIGLNAVDPEHGGRGIGTAMYEFALARMREAGMKAATVGTGGDPSHEPARRAYERAGFIARIPSVWMSRLL